MRNRAKTALVGTLVAATAALGPLGGTAHAGDSSLYAPSDLVLTIAHGEDAASVAPERAVTLTCEPQARGTHPSPQEACVLLGDAGGDVDAIAPPAEPQLCTYQYDPVVVTCGASGRAGSSTRSAPSATSASCGPRPGPSSTSESALPLSVPGLPRSPADGTGVPLPPCTANSPARQGDRGRTGLLPRRRGTGEDTPWRTHQAHTHTTPRTRRGACSC
nr:serine protease inhibitor [Streptomyces fradiae]